MDVRLLPALLLIWGNAISFASPTGGTFAYCIAGEGGREFLVTPHVSVADSTLPVAVCPPDLTVNLVDSIIWENALSFDGGSTGMHAPLTLLVRRGTLDPGGVFVPHPCNLPGDFQFGPQVRFYCCDYLHAVPVYVQLLVTDNAGNTDTCHMPIVLVDKVKPVIWCPSSPVFPAQAGSPSMAVDTAVFCEQAHLPVPAAQPGKYMVPIRTDAIPTGAVLTDVDLGLVIDHEVINQLSVTLHAPQRYKAQVMNRQSCAGQPVQIPWDMDVIFNDQAYDIQVFNATGQIMPALFTCTSSQPGFGAYNQGHMRPKFQDLKVFNGMPVRDPGRFWTFTAEPADIQSATGQISSEHVGIFVAQAGLKTGDHILLDYTGFEGAPLPGLVTGKPYLFEVTDAGTLSLVSVTGVSLDNVPTGSRHFFCASDQWLLLVEDHDPLGGGVIREVCLHLAFRIGEAAFATDNLAACGMLNITPVHETQPAECPSGALLTSSWTVTDLAGNTSGCQHQYQIVDETPLLVRFPCDATLSCEEWGDPEKVGFVRHNGDFEQMAVTYVDSVLTAPDACFLVRRTWEIRNDCRFMPEDQQEYEVLSVQAANNILVFEPAILNAFAARRMVPGDRLTLLYVADGSVPVGGLATGRRYSGRWMGGTEIRMDYDAALAEPVVITGPGTGPHWFRIAHTTTGIPHDCQKAGLAFSQLEGQDECCASNPVWEDDGDGYFRHVQEIRVTAAGAPEWVIEGPDTFCLNDAPCGATEIQWPARLESPCTPPDQVVYSWSLDLFGDGMPDLQGTGPEVQGLCPPGTHLIILQAVDACQESITLVRTIEVRDCAPPMPACAASRTVALAVKDARAQLTALSLETGLSTDNCTEHDVLTVLVERRENLVPGQAAPSPGAAGSVVFTCQDIPPFAPTNEVEVVVWVGDEAGNWSHCLTTVTVTDPGKVCQPGPDKKQVDVEALDPLGSGSGHSALSGGGSTDVRDSGAGIQDMEGAVRALVPRFDEHEESGWILLPAVPNPFRDRTTLSFVLGEEAMVTWRVFDPAGRPLSDHSGWYGAGRHTWSLHGADLPGPGVYFVQMITPQRSVILPVCHVR
ncbi:MAG: hypothetical protein J5I41_10070 [Saprospiraceae bacterium]|nr:hypothetical protein [Saprospiraceae bacterium]